MDPNEWLVTVGEGVMLACARAYLFKHFPLISWLDYCQKYGSPGLHAVTAAARDTPEWDGMTAALDQFIRNCSNTRGRDKLPTVVPARKISAV